MYVFSLSLSLSLSLSTGFTIKHYAGDVVYDADGFLEVISFPLIISLISY